MSVVIAENEYLEADFCDILPFDWEKIAKTVVDAVLLHEGCPYEAEVNLLLMNDERMRAINCAERQIDRTTDVLSFPAVQYESPSDFSICEAHRLDNFNPETNNLMLGDILISVPRVLAQATEYNHSTKREFAFLIAHSMLHLLGYDHMKEDEEKVMFQKQEEILTAIGLTRQA